MIDIAQRKASEVLCTGVCLRRRILNAEWICFAMFRFPLFGLKRPGTARNMALLNYHFFTQNSWVNSENQPMKMAKRGGLFKNNQAEFLKYFFKKALKFIEIIGRWVRLLGF
jgi:hypothetical protein